MSIADILEAYKKGELDAPSAEKKLRLDYVQRIGTHTLFDPCRSMRKDVPEIVFGENKSPQVLSDIVEEVMKEKDLLIVSRASEEHFKAVRDRMGDRSVYKNDAKMIVIGGKDGCKCDGKIGILAAGTSDVRVAEEAHVIAEAMGCEVITAYDVGIAAFHRFLDPLKGMLDGGCDAIIVVAGMEGALASVVSSL